MTDPVLERLNRGLALLIFVSLTMEELEIVSQYMKRLIASRPKTTIADGTGDSTDPRGPWYSEKGY